MGLPGYPGCSTDKCKLTGEPQNEEKGGRKRYRDEEEDRKDRNDPSAREEHQVRPHHPRYCSRGADQRRQLSRVGKHEGRSGGHPRRQVEEQIPA